jgi:iron complex outermembrane recepter protein
LQFLLFSKILTDKIKAMRLFLGTIIFLMTVSANAQIVNGKVMGIDNKPVPEVSVTLQLAESEKVSTITSSDGSFEFRNVRKKGVYDITFSHVGYTTKTIILDFQGKETNLNVQLEESALFLEPLEIRATRASERSPFAKQTIGNSEIAKNNLGQDIPYLLNQTPSVVINSDAGNGIGYTGIRIRGTDASRINMTINGIPYNDAESQGIFFVNLPDISSSASSIQIQRGVGTSSNGGGAFGATLNLSTNEFNNKPYAELNNSYGSFNTRKHTVKAGTGLINDHFTVDARLSHISTDGYVDRASSDLKSFYVSGAYITKRSTLRLNVFSGTEKTYQSWYGIDSATLATNRTFNPAGTEKNGTPYDNQTDNYQQDHYQLFFNHKLNNNWSFNTAAFLVNGAGYYEQYRDDESFGAYNITDPVIGGTTVTETDLIRQLWLDNAYYGQIGSLHYKKPGTEFTFGGGWNTYEGRHFGRVIWAEIGFPKDHLWYDLPAIKKDINIYAKWQQQIATGLEIFADAQYRKVSYKANGFRDNPHLAISRKFDFFNPKAGITYSKKGWTAFASYALGQKEPNRDDFEAGTTTQPQREQLHDIEAGIEKKTSTFLFAVNFYYMIYKDQLVLTGKINDVGAYTRSNVPNSFRRGIELQLAKRFNNWFNIGSNLTLSQNKIKAFTEFIDDYDNGGQIEVQHTNKDIAFSPAVIGGLNIDVTPSKHINFSLNSKYVSRQYLDNTQEKRRSLNAFFVQDARLNITVLNKLFSSVNIILQANNLLNTLYEPNGYTFSYFYNNEYTTENYYFPAAGRNYMVGLNIKL